MEFTTTYPCSGIEMVRITKDSHNVDIEIIDTTKNREDDKAFENYFGIIREDSYDACYEVVKELIILRTIRGNIYNACHGVVKKFIIVKQWNDYVPISLVCELVKEYIVSRKFKNTPPVFIIFDREHEMARKWMTDLYFDLNFEVADKLISLENNIVIVNTDHYICDKLYKNIYADHTCSCNKNKKESTKD